MNSEENLAESECQEEMKPRLTIKVEMQPARYAGHKMDMRDGDPIKMNDNIKERFTQDDVKTTSALRRGQRFWWVGSAK